MEVEVRRFSFEITGLKAPKQAKKQKSQL